MDGRSTPDRRRHRGVGAGWLPSGDVVDRAGATAARADSRSPVPPLVRHLPARTARADEHDADAVLDGFNAYAAAIGLELYPAQEEAIFELLVGNHVILNTPTGSGKSLVATAAHFAALAEGKRSVYTAPIKALVSEKFFALCREFGSDRVGMITGDASVNPDAPIICCTAEILANWALRDGPETPVDVAIVDEFHYYGDPQRGWAWQVPLLQLPHTQFLLMSATLGNVAVLPPRPHRPHRPRHERRHVGPAARPAALRVPHVDPPRQRRATAAGRQGADLHRPLHPEGRHRGGAELPRPRPAQQDREGDAEDRAPRLPLRHADRQGPAPLHHRRHRRPPRRAAAEVPAARREARPGRAAQDHLRHRHARRRHQRADPLGPVHPAVQVRRLDRADPHRARLPTDRRAGRAQGLRRPRRRVGAGAAARGGEPAQRREERGDRQEEREEEAARTRLRALEPGHVRQARRRRARAAAVALPGQPPDGDEPARPAGDGRRSDGHASTGAVRSAG